MRLSYSESPRYLEIPGAGGFSMERKQTAQSTKTNCYFIQGIRCLSGGD